MVVVNFYPIKIEQKALDKFTEIRIYGRRNDGRQICIVDKTYQPHFYVLLKEQSELKQFAEKIKKLRVQQNKKEAKVVRLEIFVKRYLRKNREAIKVIVENPFDVNAIANSISEWPEIEVILETDIPYIKKYVIEKNITPLSLMEAEGVYDVRQSRVPVLLANKIRDVIGERITPKVLFFNVKTQEMSGKTTSEEHPIIAISFLSDNFKKTITWKRFEIEDNSYEFYESEADLIKRFQTVIEEFQPDFLAGFLSEKFDFPYLIKRAEKYKIRLNFSADLSTIRFFKKVYIGGIAHIDLSEVVKRTFARKSELGFEDIDEIVREILNEEVIKDENLLAIKEVCRKSEEEVQFYKKIYEKLYPFILELSKLLGLTIGGSMNLNPFQIPEWYIYKNALQKNMLIPNRREETQKTLTEESGILMEPEGKIYKKIFSIDLRNMISALTAKYNIAHDSIRCACCKNLSNKNPWFCMNKKGIIPEILDDLILRKQRIKDILSGTDENKKTIALISRVEAIEVLVHYTSRYLRSSKARYYNQECAFELKRLEKNTRKEIINKAQQKGFKLVYFDKEFIFLGVGKRKKQDVYILLGIMNELFSADLDIEGFYDAGFFVLHKKNKKFVKYALLLSDKTIRTKGFELVQRNTGLLARNTQEAILKLVLQTSFINSSLRYLKEVISKLRNKEFENRYVILTNELQKEVKNYDTVWPYIAVAKRIAEKGFYIGKGSVIRYIVEQGSEKIADRAKLPEEVEEGNYDSEYYINTQLIPSIIDIFEPFGFNKKTLVESKEQTKLEGFFGG